MSTMTPSTTAPVADAVACFAERLYARVEGEAAGRAAKDPVYRKAFALWAAELRKHLEGGLPVVDGLVAITSPEVESHLVQIAVATLEVAAARIREQYWDGVGKSAYGDALREASLFEDAPGGEWRIDVWQGIIVPEIAAREQPVAEVLEIVRYLLDTSEDDLLATAQGNFPAFVAERQGSAALPALYQDLAIFMLESGAEAAELIHAVLTDSEVAGACIRRKFTPAPVKFVAGLVPPSEQ